MTASRKLHPILFEKIKAHRLDTLVVCGASDPPRRLVRLVGRVAVLGHLLLVFLLVSGGGLQEDLVRLTVSIYLDHWHALHCGAHLRCADTDDAKFFVTPLFDRLVVDGLILAEISRCSIFFE